jgi:ferrochelatase
MTYGAPSGRDDLPGYLARVRGGKDPSDELVAEFARRYERIGWSPLVRITAAQAEALERELGADAGRAFPGLTRSERRPPDGSSRVAAGMRFSRPTIAEAVEVLARDGAQRIIGVVMSPQWSDTLMGGYERALAEAVARLPERVPFAVAREWHREAAFLDSLAAAIRAALARMPDPSSVPIVLTAHSLPRRVFDAEPMYVAQLRETAELVAERAGLAPGRWRWAYQSAGHTAEEWLRPDLKELFPALAAEGHRDVLIVPVQFLADHLEVLYDLDVAAAAEAATAGLRYHRIEMPNCQPAFIRALADVARRTVGQ